MSRPPYGDPHYGITRTFTSLTFEQAIAAITVELKKEGFGILTEIDISATLKKKLGVDHRDYIILGACHPPTAHQALTAEPGVGLLLPCNVVVSQEIDGVAVSAIDPEAMLGILNRPEVMPLAQNIKAALSTAINRIEDR